MLPPRLCFIGLHLLSLTYTAQSVVMITANSDDVKNLARQFLTDSLADKLSEFLTMAKAKEAKADTENDLNDVSNSIDDTSNTGNEDIDHHNANYKKKPFRTTKDLNTPPVRDNSNLYATSKIRATWKTENDERLTSDKLARRPRKPVKKYYKVNKAEPHRFDKIENLAKALQMIDKNVQVIDLNKALYEYDTAEKTRKRDLSNQSRLHHPHIDHLKTVEEKSDSTEEVEQKRTEQSFGKPPQIISDILASSKQFSEYENNKRNPTDDFKQELDKHALNDKENRGTLKEIETNKEKEEHYFHNFNQSPKDVLTPQHVAFIKQDYNDDSKSDVTGYFKTHNIDSFKADAKEETNENPVDKTDQSQTKMTTSKSSDHIHRIPKRLLKYHKMHFLQSKQNTEPLIKLKKLHHAVKNMDRKDKLKSSRYPKKKYFPNKPKAQIAEEKSLRTFDNSDTSIESKEMKNLYHTTAPEIKESPSSKNQNPKHKQIHYFEPKPVNENSEQAKDGLKDNNDDTKISNIAHFLTTKIVNLESNAPPVSEKKGTSTNPEDSEETDVTTVKDQASISTKSTVYHGNHKVTDEILKTDNKETYKQKDSDTPTEAPGTTATSGKQKLPNKENKYARLWENLDKGMYTRPTSLKYGVF